VTSLEDMLIKDVKEEKKRKLLRNMVNLLLPFFIALIAAVVIYLLNPKLTYYKWSILIYLVFLVLPALFKLWLKISVKKFNYHIFPLVGFVIIALSILYFNYFYWKNLILILIDFTIPVIIYYYLNFPSFLKRSVLFSSILFMLILALNFLPQFFFKKDGYYSFVYLPWNSIKLEITYTWQQPVVGVKWEDKILKNGSIVKVSVPYVKDYILHEIKETVWYNFFTRDYLVKVEGLKNESNWLVITPYYQNNRSVANYAKCYFEIGEAPPKTVNFST